MIGKSMIPTHFVVLPYEKEPKDPLILGRSFLDIAGAIIDVRQGRIRLNVGDLTMQFDMNTLVKKPIIEGKTFLIDSFTSSASDSISEMEWEDPLERVLVSSIEDSADLDIETSTYTKLLDETEHVMQLQLKKLFHLWLQRRLLIKIEIQQRLLKSNWNHFSRAKVRFSWWKFYLSCYCECFS